MQKQKCSLKLYSNFLIANHNRFSGLELSKSIKEMAHDSVSRWLSNSHFTPSDLWSDVKNIVDVRTGYLIGDDTLLEKKYSYQNELVKKQYSGNLHQLEKGISLVNLLWTGDLGEEYIPVDYRVYKKEYDDKTKNDHFCDMLKRAKNRGFRLFTYCLTLGMPVLTISNLLPIKINLIGVSSATWLLIVKWVLSKTSIFP